MEGRQSVGVGRNMSAPSHITLAAREGGAVAADAEHRKRLKYTHLERSHYFVPVAIETIGAHGPEAKLFFRELARHHLGS